MGVKIVADDFGMSLDINHAISDLVRRRIVSKVSVAADKSVEYSSSEVGGNVGTGLHINLLSKDVLGNGRNNKSATLLKFLRLVLTGKLNARQIINIIDTQFNILEQKGFKISYLDTHQHVHIIPVILKSLIEFARTKKINSIRCITMERKYLIHYLYSLMRFGFSKQLLKIILLYLMGIYMKKKLDKAKIKYCKNLVLMPLANCGDYKNLLRELLRKFKDKDAELVIHPGLKTGTVQFDDYNERYIEYCSVLELASNDGKREMKFNI